MPVWNGMPFIREAITSVINQRYKNWQLIISDDGSTDGTVDYLKKIKNKKIKIFYQKKNLGIFGNLKFLNSKSNTSLVKIFCQDDRMYKNCLKRTYGFMTKFDDCKLMSCNKFQHYKNILGRHYYIYEQLGNKEFIKFPPKASMIAFFTLGNICGNLSQVTYKKFNNKYFPSFQKKITIAGDYYAWAKYSYKYGTYIIPDKLVYVRTHAKQASNYLNMKNDYYFQLPIVYEYLLNRIKLGDEFLSGQVSNKSINNILLTYGFLGIDSNYKSLVSTGAIEYINNKSLVKELTSYYEIDYSLLNDISGQYKHFYYGMFEFMLANYPTESMNKLILTDNKIDFTNKPLELQYDKQSLLKLYNDSEFRSRVYSLKRIVIVYIGFYQQAFDRNKKLSSLIENELNN